MPVPRLLHPVPCEIQPADKSRGHTNAAREPLRIVRRKATITIPAQNSIGVPPYRLDPQGLRASATGYLLVRRVDCEGREYAPDTGDRIVRIGRDSVDLYVVSVEPTAHYPDQVGATMFRLYYGTR